jgi:hypothetical protein
MKRVSLVVVLTGLVAMLSAAAGPSDRSSLPVALEDWVSLIEKDDVKSAGGRWAKDEKAAAQIRGHWPMIRRAHQAHDYRKWFDGKGRGDAADVGDANQFKLGGHEFGHVHVDWEKTDAGWRVAAVWICR